MSNSPHGGELVNRFIAPGLLAAAEAGAAGLPALTLTPWSVTDLELIAMGGFSPLTGFLGSADYRGVIHDMYLQNGLLWPIPITLPVSREQADTLAEGSAVALRGPDGTLLGTLNLTEKYLYDKETEAKLVYRTTDPAHPGVAKLYAQGDVLLAGPIRLFRRPPRPFPELPDEPALTRRLFAERGWRQVVAFQTRNPIHRAHEYIQKIALELVDGLFIQPLVGPTKDDDVPAAVRVQSYHVLLEKYYPAGRALLGAYPAAMRYAGPREAVLHALVRKNYGCTHFIVGRDHAGVGNYYGSYDAQELLRALPPAALGITPLCFEHTFYCRACGGMASAKTCPHPAAEHVILSGTQVRAMLRAGQLPPQEFSRPEVAEVLAGALAAQA